VPLLDQSQGLLNVFRFATKLQVGLTAERQSNTLAHDWMVVHDQDSASGQK